MHPLNEIGNPIALLRSIRKYSAQQLSNWKDEAPQSHPASLDSAAVTTDRATVAIALNPPKEKRVPTPGVYYMLKRITSESRNGVIAAMPAEKVTLLGRKAGDIVKITNGLANFEVDEADVTNDPNIADEVARNLAPSIPLLGQSGN